MNEQNPKNLKSNGLGDTTQTVKHISEIMAELGFSKAAPESTGHALILNLIRSAYGQAAAQEAAREILKLRNGAGKKDAEFTKSNELSTTSPTEQLSLFDRKLG